MIAAERPAARDPSAGGYGRRHAGGILRATEHYADNRFQGAFELWGGWGLGGEFKSANLAAGPGPPLS